MSLIQLKGITRSFGKHIVLKNVNLSIEYKDIYGIIGLSGSGKTTILNILIGFLRPSSGLVLYKDRPISKYQALIQQTFGFATQGGSFYNKLNIEENLNYFGSLYNMDKREIKQRINELLRLVELEDARYVLASRLSTGMQRRLDIACALMHNPKVLILDEPTEDLDPVLRKEVLALIKKINDAGTTIVITSHLLSEMETVCNEIAILHNGEILETGTPDEIKLMYSKNEEIHLETSPGNYDRILRHLKKADLKNVIKKQHKLIIYTPKAEKVLKDIMRALTRTKERLIDLDVNKPSLEEVFEALTGRRK